MLNNISSFIQIKFLELTNHIKVDEDKLFIYKSTIPKVIINNSKLNERVKELGWYEPNYDSIVNIDCFINLEELCIRFFQHDELPENIWNLKKLKMLKLEQCEISKLPTSIKNLTSLEYLNLSCKIKSLPKEIGLLKKLKTLNLSRSYLLKKIVKLPESLEKLIIDNENLTLSDDILMLPNLRKLEIINTKIKKLPESISSCEKLYHLYIETNVKDFELSPQIGNLLKLDYLELGGLGIKNINFEFSNLKNLKELRIANTNISNIPDSICECFKLRDLTIEETPITELPVNIGQLKALSKLNLEYTNIKKLRRSVSNLKNLKYLYIPEGVELNSVLEEMEDKGKLEVNYSSHFDDSSRDDEDSIESFESEFGIINRSKDIWMFE